MKDIELTMHIEWEVKFLGENHIRLSNEAYLRFCSEVKEAYKTGNHEILNIIDGNHTYTIASDSFIYAEKISVGR